MDIHGYRGPSNTARFSPTAGTAVASTTAEVEQPRAAGSRSVSRTPAAAGAASTEASSAGGSGPSAGSRDVSDAIFTCLRTQREPAQCVKLWPVLFVRSGTSVYVCCNIYYILESCLASVPPLIERARSRPGQDLEEALPLG